MDTNEKGKAYERVIRYVKDEISNGTLQEGQKLPPERDMAEQLGVGRNSVREALRILGILGVISSTQGAGNYVTSNFEHNLFESMTMMSLLQKTDYHQISELRQGIELMAATLAVDRIDEEKIARLETIVQELGQGQIEERNVMLDKELHYTIATASQNKLIVAILQALSEVMDYFIKDLRHEILADEAHRDELQASHEGMVRGLRLRDKEIITAAINEHFRLVEEHL